MIMILGGQPERKTTLKKMCMLGADFGVRALFCHPFIRSLSGYLGSGCPTGEC